MLRFCDELIARVRRAGAAGACLLRADSGFWNTKVFDRLAKAGWQFSIGVRMTKPVTAAVAAIAETAWKALADYPETGEAQIAETTLSGRRLIFAASVCSPPKASCSPASGVISRSRPTAAKRSSSSSQSIASTPSSSSSSATSKTRRFSTSPPGTTAPTPPGR